ncbi:MULTISPECIES: hypothetical protein [Rhizobium/Agrobacterium group]|uniref:hypothetical protein n=1 Tax=Rhizobium/Agrobacterium group TaxID=227290 RepID=UPI000714AF88|nr:hypothetical protein [Rhizobium sp. Root483D2]KQY26597.1 hypothetical protein ASD32_25325 [Rhizobium sp. Root483D2]
MSRRPVQKVMPISAVASSPPVEIGQTNSILSDPDGRWVAKRQGEINEAFEKRMRLAGEHGTDSVTPSHDGAQNVELSEKPAAKLSGESDRIGRHEWDANTPFGKHVGFF